MVRKKTPIGLVIEHEGKQLIITGDIVWDGDGYIKTINEIPKEKIIENLNKKQK